jgi:excisionase family DNA binding protein
MAQRLLTTREAAELLNVSARTVTNWIRRDRVPYLRLPGGEYRLPLEGLLDSLSGTYDIRPDVEGPLAPESRAMSERLERVHLLSKQMTAIAGTATE